MFKALAYSRLRISSFYSPSLAPKKTVSLRPPLLNNCWRFAESKDRLPRNKEEAWMMQEQQKLKERPGEDD